MEVFWAHGYEGASLADLTQAMGINAPSLYAAFGCKEALFREAVDLYVATEGSETARALTEQPTARLAIDAMLRRNSVAFARPASPGGCLVVLGDRNCTPEHATVRDYLTQRRQDNLAAIEQRLSRGIAEGDLPPGADVKAMAGFYITVLQGLSLQARDGASVAAMGRTVDCAMAAWDLLASRSQMQGEPAKRPTRSKAVAAKGPKTN
jgi:AcrR family transcriptional regulator